ncbi:PSD1 and planctomycete cytochrome C domain-containing protein [Anatilimnocola sp. NA78]|uniref:PSD1 and planctomycete cytochrome C domain-containing protein n=1 Tax=Anatilimnocola sp. NA78 TaxID=3415683 RepID=UPI003CE4EF25
MNENRHKDNQMPTRISAVVLLLLFSAGGLAAEDQVVEQRAAERMAAERMAAEQLFVRRIAPLLQSKCLACHGYEGKERQGNLDLRSPKSTLRGGDSGPAVVAGKPEQSPLYLAVTRASADWSAMPPKESEKLTANEVGWIKTWIAAGAPWPDAARSREIERANSAQWSAEDGISVKTSGGLSAAWTERKYKPESLWAYQPIQKPSLTAKGKHPIDQLIEAKLPVGLTVAPAADRVTLIRRATYDLTGLPPTPAEVAAFASDERPLQVAFSALVERLLASPHYGERMAQHWLDVVRYADSSGFANDYERGNAWRYRDYVVRSFNDDKPYDQFVREQIAGDEIDSDNSECLVATGFLRMGPWELTGMEVAKVARQRFLDDVTNSVGETFLAHSLQCARCHDHKFDPIPTRDYYSIQAVFATTQLAEREAPFVPQENVSGFDERKYLEQRRTEYLEVLKQLDEKLLANAARWFVEQKRDPAEWNKAVQQVSGRRGERDGGGIFNGARNLLLQQKLSEEDFPPKLVGFTPQDYGLERVARKGLERLKWELERYEPYALAVYNGRTPQLRSVNSPLRIPADRETTGELEVTCILTGGDPFSPGDKVRSGVLSVIANGEMAAANDPGIDGRRISLANWIASKQNPLTARVMANRLWLWHFGQPLAGNPNNFGSTGKRPTHPELLDWLANKLMESNWSLKAVHREILSSAAYRRSTQHGDLASVKRLDPLGTSYAVFQPRRLSAEELRDSQLAITGELNRTLGGIPNRPEINLEVALQPRQVMGTFAAAWIPNPLPEQRHRRSLYALKLRGLIDPHLDVFNAPGPDFSCEWRQASLITPQVFTLFNGQASHARALALAHRAVNQTTADDEALKHCFSIIYARQPTPDELRHCLNHWREIEALLPEVAHATANRQPLEVVRDAVEENTGERFTFREKLHANAEFVPDLQPADVSRRTRALADICLALFNSNEFVYVY